MEFLYYSFKDALGYVENLVPLDDLVLPNIITIYDVQEAGFTEVEDKVWQCGDIVLKEKTKRFSYSFKRNGLLVQATCYNQPRENMRVSDIEITGPDLFVLLSHQLTPDEGMFTNIIIYMGDESIDISADDHSKIIKCYVEDVDGTILLRTVNYVAGELMSTSFTDCGQPHCRAGPAVIDIDGESYYLDGIKLSKREWNKRKGEPSKKIPPVDWD